MNWLEKMLDKGAGKLGYAKAAPEPSMYQLQACPAARLPDPAAHNYAAYSRAYTDRGWIYACVSAITDAVASLEPRMRDCRGGIVQAHPALSLVERPNAFMSGRALKAFLCGSLELTGNAYILKDSRVNGRPTELFPLLPQLVEIIPGRNTARPVKEYRYRAGGRAVSYLPEDVIHFRYFNPSDFFYGLSPLAAARHAADTLHAAENYNRAFFENSASISGVLSTEQRLDEATRLRIIKAWNDRHRGETNAHKTALLEGGLRWQSIGMTQKDMDFVEGMKLNREALLAIFRVPPALVGVYDHAPQFNTREQQKIFYQSCVIPKITLICECLTEFLLPDFGEEGLYFEPDLSGVTALREDETARAAAAETYFRMGFTKEEIVRALNLPFKAEGRAARQESI